MLAHLTIAFNLGVHLRYEEDLSFSFLPICTFGGEIVKVLMVIDIDDDVD